MKSKFVFFAICLLFSSYSFGQYTPLPQLDKSDYNQFVETLRTQAVEQDMPELVEVADKMTYDEARRFMANPYVFAEKLKNEVKPDGTRKIDEFRVGLIVNLLFNLFSGYGDSWNNLTRMSFALGLYAMYSLGSIYIMSEFLYMYRIGGQEYGQGTNVFKQLYKISYLTLFVTVLYAVQLESMQLFLGLGPLLAFAISGKVHETDNGVTTKEDLEIGENGLSGIQTGLNFYVGLAISKAVMIYAAYNMFFHYLFKNGPDFRMNMFRIGVAIAFGNSKAK